MHIYINVKIWNSSSYSMVGSLQTGSEVRTMAVSSGLIYLGCKGGTVEIWDKKKSSKVDTLQMGTNCRVNCMALDRNEEVLVIGTSDGQIQVTSYLIQLLNDWNFTLAHLLEFKVLRVYFVINALSM